jgi:hypothetical protein
MTHSPEQRADGQVWTTDGVFAGADGRAIGYCDDVLLTRAIAVRDGVRTTVSEVPEGTICTVMFWTEGPNVLADLECYIGEDAFAFGYEEGTHLKLHQSAEEKRVEWERGR